MYRLLRFVIGLVLALCVVWLAAPALAVAQTSFADVISAAQPKMAKLYGAGGVRGLESYQSGFLISAEGHILTVWSYVLDTDYITATLNDGRKYEAKLVGADPRLELAVLKIEATELPHFELAASVPAESGTRVLAFSNLFGVAAGDEPDSVLHGSVAVKTKLDARRGNFESPYRGPVYVLDAMTNNPGAAGGALTNQHGELLAMLGKEMRNSLTNTWINYSLPIDQLSGSVEEILAGKSRPASAKPTKKRGGPNPAALGLVMVPDVLERTPPYVDQVRPDSSAAKAGLQADDLVLFVDQQLINSCKALDDELSQLDRDSDVKLVVMRGQELIDLLLKVDPAATPKEKESE